MNSRVDGPVTHAVERVTQGVTYAASGSAFAFGMTANEFAAMVGMTVAILSFIVSTTITWHFKSKHYKLVSGAIKPDTGHRRRKDDWVDG